MKAQRVDIQPKHHTDSTVLAPAAGVPASWEREREQLLEMLTHQQRIAQMGLITSGLVHDINHHLLVMSGSAELALLSGDPRQYAEALERVKQSCRAMDDTTRAFLGLVRRRAPSAAPAPAAEAVRQAARLLKPLAHSHRVDLEVQAGGARLLDGDARLLTQAVVNLGSNAVRACAATKGRVVLLAGERASGAYRIEVADNGPGIPESVRRSIFRPFATGAAPGQGTGMGLFIVRQAVRRLGGTIRVRSSEAGTQFQIDLPPAAEDASS